MDSYEKKYKEMKARVLEIGQGYVKGVDFSKPRQIAEYIDPELVESEDERIRKALIDGFKRYDDGALFNGCLVREILVWLENQNSNADNANKEYWRGYREGKQEVIDKYAELEKQGEEKPADKVEQKFKVGDWAASIVSGLRSPLRIVSISDTEYKVEDTQGATAKPKIEYLDKHYHLWTIDDAKDGDVLSYEDKEMSIFRYKLSGLGAGLYMSYVLLTDKIEFKQTCTIDNVYPATKEQRDILFQKMNEAGYEWDAGRKEARPLSKSEATSDSVTQTLVDTAKAFLQALADTPYNNTPIVEAQAAVKQLLTFLSDPKAYDPNAINEHKSAEWSEEDEQLIDEVVVCLRKYAEKVQGGYSKSYVQSLADRIESLRPGNTCKATEWSEEDEAMFQGVIETEQYMLDVVYGRKIFAVGNEDLKEECTKELAWLKSLRPQKQWKSDWSEKDEKLLKLSLENLTELKNRFGEGYGKVGDCIYWLKSLKDRIK